MTGLVIDSFAGGGGASLGIEWALGRAPDVAINHDRVALAIHRANHPDTRHYEQDVWAVDPREATGGRPVDLMWLSPDCTHFSKARGQRPTSRRVRGLAWLAVRWAAAVKPRVIALENVEEFTTWGPLNGDRPCRRRRGTTFRLWCNRLRGYGYRVEWRELRACDYGAPTTRNRLFIIARCDGLPIRWPEPTHFPPGDNGELFEQGQPWRTAAECIDWSLPCPSIFERRRPLAEATCRRIARGIQRYVVEAAEPFIVTCNHGGWDTTRSVHEPMRTVTAARDAHGLVVPHLVAIDNKSSATGGAFSAEDPVRTTTTENRHALVAAFLAQHNGGMVGHDLREPVSTITERGSHQQLVTSHLLKLRGTCRDGQPLAEPAPTLTAGGWHVGEVRAFLMTYYGNGTGQDLRDPMRTVTAKDRLGLVTVHGQDYQIVDIGMRMLTARELFRAQGFPDDYVIDVEVDGRPISGSAKVRACGNSVCPQVAAAVVRANCAGETAEEVAA